MKVYTITKVLKIDIEADTKEQALEIAQYDKSLYDYEEYDCEIEISYDYEHIERYRK